MSDNTAEGEVKPKKGKGMLMKILMGVGLLGVGGGAAFGALQAGIIGESKHVEEDNNPKLVRKGEEDPYAPKSEGKEGEGAMEVDGEGGSEYRTSYYSFQQEFTSNLKNSPALLQVELAASTRRDGRVLIWMKKHELAIRSAMLSEIANTTEDEVYSLEGKQQLQKRLAGAINKVLEKNEGFGGVDNVFFTTFIIQ
ncbi:MAG: flagellar basal body-associated FliL family protein [Novosphingobium sp.]|nr:flagellar basal body-associated FliL family protein [Novosphingobium sp.]MCP5401083.1 flagellar basal body-associated FliL family protein [Novosphingobium sp.]